MDEHGADSDAGGGGGGRHQVEIFSEGESGDANNGYIGWDSPYFESDWIIDINAPPRMAIMTGSVEKIRSLKRTMKLYDHFSF